MKYWKSSENKPRTSCHVIARRRQSAAILFCRPNEKKPAKFNVVCKLILLAAKWFDKNNDLQRDWPNSRIKITYTVLSRLIVDIKC